jgi:plasmid stabilization system protein ParE
MSLKLEVRTRAQRDLRAIVLYIAGQNGDFAVAQRFGMRLLDRCEDLLSAPGKGMAYRPRAGIRKLNEGAYKIFYQVTKTRVVILRIWDGRRAHDPKVSL